MPVTLNPSPSLPKQQTASVKIVGCAYTVAEIQAYIAIRDQLLAEAEDSHTRSKLESTALANDFVQGCLRPAKSPYETQCLPESDAVRERQRCETIRERIAALSSNVA